MIVGDVSTKGSFANALRAKATELRAILDDMVQLRTVYAARGYASGGTDPITDADVSGSKLTASDITHLLADAWLVARLDVLMNNQTPTSGTINGYAYLDAVRSDM